MEQINNYQWLDFALPPGWEKLGYDMIKECEAIEPTFEIIDLKEKWGMIRMYYYPHTDTLEEIENKYEQLSAKTCCQCGAPATKISTGWILPWCDKCGKKEEKYYTRF